MLSDGVTWHPKGTSDTIQKGNHITEVLTSPLHWLMPRASSTRQISFQTLLVLRSDSALPAPSEH